MVCICSGVKLNDQGKRLYDQDFAVSFRRTLALHPLKTVSQAHDPYFDEDDRDSADAIKLHDQMNKVLQNIMRDYGMYVEDERQVTCSTGDAHSTPRQKRRRLDNVSRRGEEMIAGDVSIVDTRANSYVALAATGVAKVLKRREKEKKWNYGDDLKGLNMAMVPMVFGRKGSRGAAVNELIRQTALACTVGSYWGQVDSYPVIMFCVEAHTRLCETMWRGMADIVRNNAHRTRNENNQFDFLARTRADNAAARRHSHAAARRSQHG